MADMNYQLRPSQAEILKYRRGRMGISAVPGAGKTWTLSLLAAEILARGELADDQEVLVVTLVNSAVDSFYGRVSQFMQGHGLLANLGYRVRTLHGLAHDIVRERPELAGLDERFQIIDEREANGLVEDIARAWLRAHPYELDDYLASEDDNQRDWLRREQLPGLVQGIAANFIRSAKDLEISPERLEALIEQLPVPLPLAEMGAHLYRDYQSALAYRGAVDFDDLIRLALVVLRSDRDLVARLRSRWPFILEDEAQDSSRLQEEILRLLAGSQGNWVRVGDPNQAIYETFTTASPKYLREFLNDIGVEPRDLPESGRSSASIIRLANELVRWTMADHPAPEARDALHAPPSIELTPPGDPQPNPPDQPAGIQLIMRKFSPQEEIEAVADSLARWLPEHPEETVAALAPRNQRAFDLVDALRKRNVRLNDSLLRSSSSTRFSAGALAHILRYLSDPQSPRKLSRVYEVWRRNDRQDESAKPRLERQAELLRKCPRVEDYLWPSPGIDWLAGQQFEDDPIALEQLLEFRELVRRWQASTLLPVDQIVLGLSQDLLSEPAELAVAHKLAVLLRQAADLHPGWRLPQLTEELALIAKNERRFLGFSEDDSGFDPDRYKGVVVVATMHKAKGLEWDRVYLMSVNNYDFPSGQGQDTFMAERYFIRNGLNLEAEALAQLKALVSSAEDEWYQEGEATLQARLDYVRERLRLLYVGITRAKRELIITWNTGRRSKTPAQPAAALVALHNFWQEQ